MLPSQNQGHKAGRQAVAQPLFLVTDQDQSQSGDNQSVCHREVGKGHNAQKGVGAVPAVDIFRKEQLPVGQGVLQYDQDPA